MYNLHRWSRPRHSWTEPVRTHVCNIWKRLPHLRPPGVHLLSHMPHPLRKNDNCPVPLYSSYFQVSWKLPSPRISGMHPYPQVPYNRRMLNLKIHPAAHPSPWNSGWQSAPVRSGRCSPPLLPFRYQHTRWSAWNTHRSGPEPHRSRPLKSQSPGHFSLRHNNTARRKFSPPAEHF